MVGVHVIDMVILVAPGMLTEIVDFGTNVGVRRQKKMLLEEENSWRTVGVEEEILTEDLWCVNCN